MASLVALTLYLFFSCSKKKEVKGWCHQTSIVYIASGIFPKSKNHTNTSIPQVLLNRNLIAVNQDKLGKGGNRIGTYDCPQGSEYCQVWAKELSGGSYAVAFYNSVR